MKSLQILPGGFIALGCFLGACGHSQVENQPNLAIATSSTTSLQKPPIVKHTREKASKSGKMIGQLIDCDNDGQQDDARIDYDDDGIPDECVIGNETPQVEKESLPPSKNEPEPQTIKENYQAERKAIEQAIAGCQETQKTENNINYSICKLNGQPVKASESHAELGDGLGFWFKANKVRAVQFFHTGEILIFNDGRLEAKISDEQTVETVFSDDERNHAEQIAKDGYHKIFQVFNLL